MLEKLKTMNRWAILFSVVGIIGALLVAVRFVLPGMYFYLISDIGFIALIFTGKQPLEQAVMWVAYTGITVIGIIFWSG